MTPGIHKEAPVILKEVPGVLEGIIGAFENVPGVHVEGTGAIKEALVALGDLPWDIEEAVDGL